MRSPFRLPDEINFHVADLRNAGEAVVDLLENQTAGGALRGGQGHCHFHKLSRQGWSRMWVRLDGRVVDQAQIDEIQLYLRVEAVTQGNQDVVQSEIR